MTIVLNHTIVPARDKITAAQFFANIFGLPFEAGNGHFAPVRVNDSLTLLFDDDSSFGSQHYAFHVSDDEFDSITAAPPGVLMTASSNSRRSPSPRGRIERKPDFSQIETVAGTPADRVRIHVCWVLFIWSRGTLPTRVASAIPTSF